MLSLSIIACTNAQQNGQPMKKKVVAAAGDLTGKFEIWGNCGMCKKTIEKAAMSVAGVKSANWDVDSHVFEFILDPLKTKVEKLHAAVAAAGYDTELVRGDDRAYNNLHGCCQYERKQ